MAFCFMKGHVLHAKMPPFGIQKAAFLQNRFSFQAAGMSGCKVLEDGRTMPGSRAMQAVLTFVCFFRAVIFIKFAGIQ